jgi:phosphoglycerol transferase MdoB-like AlkP superfamily enzyme
MNKQFYFYLLKLYGLGLLLLSLLRIGFFAYYYNEVVQNENTDIVLAFMIGIMMDSNAVSMALLLCFLISSPFKLLSQNYTRLFYFLYNISIAVILFTNLADIFYFKQYGTRMNALATEIFTHFDIVIPMLYKGFPVIKVLLICVLLAFLFMRWHKKQFDKQNNDQKAPKPVVWFVISAITFFVTSFLLYGMPLWYITSFSTSSLLNQMCSNGMYTFVKSIDQKRIYNQDLSVFPEISDEDGIRKVQEISLHTNETHEDSWWPTMRQSVDKVPGQPKNIVIIVVETFSAINIGCLNGNPLSPQYDRWSQKGVSLTHCYANGSRTQQGITSIISGFPAVLGNSLIRRKGLNEFHSLGNMLIDAGYETQFIHNGKADYDDMDLFLTQGGFSSITDVENYASWRFKNNWGVCDEDLFDKAYPMIWSKKGGKPKLSVLLTMSNHAPFDIPPYFAKSHPEVKNMQPSSATFYYTDYAIGKFLDQCAKHPDFKNTLFIIVADHGEPYEPKHLNYKMFHIPALILNSSKPSGNYDNVCSQVDLAPTVLREAGYTGTYHFMGQNLFSKDYHPFAISRTTGDAVYMQMSNGKVFIRDMTSLRQSMHQMDKDSYIGDAIVSDTASQGEMDQFFKTYMQGISVIYRNGLYQYKVRNN